MKLLWSRRRDFEDRILQAIKDLETRVATTSKSTSDALAKLQELEDEESAGAGARTLRLTGACAVLLLLAGFFTYFGVIGVANPLALPSLSDSADFAVQGSAPTAKVQNDSPAVPLQIFATFDQDDHDYADYELVAPAAYAGKKYAIVLEGNARIDEPASLMSQPPFSSKSVNCKYPAGYTPTSTSPCQLIIGTFPKLTGFGAGEEMSAPGECSQNGKFGASWTNKYVEISIAGASHMRTNSNWAYDSYSLPSLVSMGWGSSVDQWYGISLGGWYQPGITSGCRVDILPVEAEVTDEYEPATQSYPNVLVWQSIDGVAALVTRQRDADEIGNALLAIGATTGALAIGFIPLAYEANRMRRRARKRNT